MTYYLLQASAMFLVAYFVGCFCGCLAKTILGHATDEELALDGPADDRVRAPAVPVQRSVVPPPAPAPTPVMARTSAPAQPVPPPPARRPAAPPPARPAGSGVSAEVTAAAAAATVATAAVAAAKRTPAAPVAPVVPAGPPEDLKRIKGIGPEIERKLNVAGITRYAQIAAWSASDVARVNTALGQDGRVQHENWIEQAQILARDGETAFSRRVDRSEVTGGMADTWRPTAPSQVVNQAIAAAPVPATVAPPSAAPAAAGAMASAASAAAAAAVAAAGSIGTAGRVQAVPPPPAPPLQATQPVTPPAPPAAPQTVPAQPPSAQPVSSQPISMRPAPGAGNQRRFVRLAAPEGKPDDISLIDGIGDKTASDLNRYGIYHFWQLASMGPDDIDYMESRIGHKGQMRRQEWPEQARELMAGKPPRAKTDRDRAGQPGQPAGPAPTAHTHRPPAAQDNPAAPPRTLPPAPVQAAPAAPAATPVVPPQAAPVHPPHQHQPLTPHTPHTGVHHHPAAPNVAPPAAASGSMTAGAAAAAAAAAVAASASMTPPMQAQPPAPPAPVQAAAPPPPPPPAPAPVQTAAPVQAVAAPGPAAAPVAMPPAAPAAAAPVGADAPAPPNWTPRSRPGNPAGTGARDDLKRIKGIGVVIEKKLEAMGITSYAQIAGWTTADVDKVSNALDFKGRIEREGWVEQARILGGGGQTDFSRRMDRGDMPGGRA